MPALILSESGDDVTDDDNDQEVNHDETTPPTSQKTETEPQYFDEEIDPSEVFPDLATQAPTLETVTEVALDVTENEVETQATLIEVLDEIFEDPSLPREEHQDVPRSPQLFVPTPIPTLTNPLIENIPALTFENPLDEDEHAFHKHFLSSVEGEASLVEKMFRDEQDIAEQEALHHHEEHEEGHHEEENEIQTNVRPRPAEHKGRRVLKKRPIRIKIPAGLRQNLQVIPESLTQIPGEDDGVRATPPATPITIEPVAFPQQTVFNNNLLNRPAAPSPSLEPVLHKAEQEPRQPKALTVFSADYDDTPEEVIPGQQADNVRQEAVPQNFSPIFAVPSHALEEEPRSGGLLQQQNVNIDTSRGAGSAALDAARSTQFAPAPAVPGFNAAQTAANSPPTFRPILRQPSDYIFTPQQFSAPTIQQQQQPQQFANNPFQQQSQQQFRPQSFQNQPPQQQRQSFNFAPNPPQQQQQQQQQEQAFTSFSPPVSQRGPTPLAPAPALSFQEPTREQKAFPQQQTFNNNFLNRPTTPTPPPAPQQQQEQFNTNFAPQPQAVPPPQTFSQSTPPQTQAFDTNFGTNNNFDNSNNNFNSNFGSSSIGLPLPSSATGPNEEQSLFAMINREVADRPVRTKLQESDKSILRNTPK